MKNNKITVIIVFISLLLIVCTGTTLAFFNYTRTGAPNRLSVGDIYFTSNYDNAIRLKKIFPNLTPISYLPKYFAILIKLKVNPSIL